VLSDARAEAETLKSQVADLTTRLQNQQAELDTARQDLEQAQPASAASTQPVSDAKAQAAAGEDREAGAAEIAALQTAGPDTDGDGITDAMDLCPETQQGAAVEPTGCVAGAAIDLDGVTFSDDGYELSDEARRVLDPVAEILRQHSDLRFQVAAHTDARGDPAHNQWLSLQRAQTVRDYLVAKGVDARHIGAVGYGGQRQPVADSATSEGQQTNQRVEIRSLR
jgi:OOP family OmpA-OmpF porin